MSALEFRTMPFSHLRVGMVYRREHAHAWKVCLATRRRDDDRVEVRFVGKTGTVVTWTYNASAEAEIHG